MNINCILFAELWSGSCRLCDVSMTSVIGISKMTPAHCESGTRRSDGGAKVMGCLGVLLLGFVMGSAESHADISVDVEARIMASLEPSQVQTQSLPLQSEATSPPAAISDRQARQILFLSRAGSLSELKGHQYAALGFERSTLSSVQTLLLPPLSDVQAQSRLRESLSKAGQIRTVITWGEGAVALADSVTLGAPSLVAGVSGPLEGVRGLQVVRQPDPAILISGTKQFMPALEKVHVVTDAEASGWLLAHMRQALAERDMQLIVHSAKQATEQARAYRQVLLSLDPAREALWLPSGRGAVTETLLPLILKVAWQRRMPVLTSQIEHVEQGVLLGVTTDLQAQGAAVASFEQQGHQTPALDGVRLVSGATRLALNRRAAERLGITLLPHHLEQFAYVVPD